MNRLEDKPRQRYMLIREFNMLINRLLKVAQSKSTPTVDEYNNAFEDMAAGMNKFIESARVFTIFGDETPFSNRYLNILNKIISFHYQYTQKLDSIEQHDLDEFHKTFISDLESFDLYIKDQINKVKIEWKSKSYDANTQFTTHLRILEIIDSARNRIDIVDPHLRSNFFILYLADLDKSIKIRILTASNNSNIKKIKEEYIVFNREFKNSELLLKNDELHDRNLRVDNVIFDIGSGFDILGKYPTNISLGDCSEEGNSKLEKLIKDSHVLQN